jgi:sugar lactone lactonase YvrE
LALGLLLASGTVAGRAGAAGGDVLGEVPCPAAEPMGMASGDGLLWISDLATRSILKVAPQDGSTLGSLPAVGLMPTGLAWQGDVLYAADRRRDEIARRRPGQPSDLSPIPYYERWATGMAHDGQSLWVVDSRNDAVLRLDPIDGTTVASFDAPASAPTGLAFDGAYLWVADHESDELYQVDRRDGSVLTILPSPGPYPSALEVYEGALWVADYQDRKLYRVELPGQSPYVEDDERRVRVTYEVVFRARGAGAIEDLTAYLALPPELPGQHRLGELELSPKPARVETDRWGQRVAVLEVGRLAAGETRSVRWQGDFALYRTRFHLQPAVVDAGAPLPDAAPYLEDDKKYDLSSKAVTDLVDELLRSEVGTYRRARALYQHLTEVITYDRSSGWNNAATVLERGTGSCSEYTFALVALLRKAGIPARYVGAISERGDEASFDDVFHRWAEAYLPGYGWVPLDANAGQGKPPGERGSFFGGRSNRHVVTTIGGGASEYLDWTYNSHETYRVEGSAELEVRPIARYRPLGDAGGSKPALRRAPAAEPTDPPAAPKTPPSSRPPWWLVFAAVIGGFGLGAVARRRRSSR